MEYIPTVRTEPLEARVPVEPLMLDRRPNGNSGRSCLIIIDPGDGPMEAPTGRPTEEPTEELAVDSEE
jgi:hypothetical protein